MLANLLETSAPPRDNSTAAPACQKALHAPNTAAAAAHTETKPRYPTAIDAATPAIPVVMTRHRSSAPRAAPLPADMRLRLTSLWLPSLANQPNVLEYKSAMKLKLVQNRSNFELNGRSPRSRFLCCSNHRLTQALKTSFSAASLVALSCACFRRGHSLFQYHSRRRTQIRLSSHVM